MKKKVVDGYMLMFDDGVLSPTEVKYPLQYALEELHLDEFELVESTLAKARRRWKKIQPDTRREATTIHKVTVTTIVGKAIPTTLEEQRKAAQRKQKAIRRLNKMVF